MNRKIGIVGPEMFNEKFYGYAYPDVEYQKGKLYCHYLKIGATQNRLPSKEIFRSIYPLFNLKIYKRLSPELNFKHKEQYYSHFHHCGFDQGKYFGFRNEMFVNKARLYAATGKLNQYKPPTVCCSSIGPVFPNSPGCLSQINAGNHPHKSSEKHERKRGGGERGHKHKGESDHKHESENRHGNKHKHEHEHEHEHFTDNEDVDQPIIYEKPTIADKNTNFELATPKIQPVNETLVTDVCTLSGPSTAAVDIGVIASGEDTLTDIINKTNEALLIIAKIKRERDNAIKVIDGADRAIKTIYGTMEDELVVGEVQTHTQPQARVQPQVQPQVEPQVEPQVHSQSETSQSPQKPKLKITPIIEPQINEESEEVVVSLKPQSSPPIWAEINLLPYARSTNGSCTYREFVKFNYSEDGSIIIQQLALPVNEGLEFTAEMPHNWKNNTMIIPHLHWTSSTDMYDLTENISLTWMIKSVGTSFDNSDKNTRNTFNQSLVVGPEKAKVHVRSDFVPGTPIGLTGEHHIIVGHLRRLTSGPSYTDDLFIIGLDLSIICFV
jgi:hypothetical protein